MAQQPKANSLPVTLPSDMDAIPITGSITASIPPDQPITVADLGVAIKNILDLLANPISQDPNSGRLRVSVDSIATALTLTTVTTLSNMTAIGSVSAGSTVLDLMQTMWANSVRPRIT
jgi:hypothetical protein